VGASVVDLLVRVGLAESRRAGRELVSGGAVQINGRKVETPTAAVSRQSLLHGRYVILRKGKKSYHLVTSAEPEHEKRDETA
jgi:tyrosyl-tRNA synthetase